MIANRQFNRYVPSRQDEKQETNRKGLIHIRHALKSLVIEWYCRGILPERVVEKTFKLAKLGDV